MMKHLAHGGTRGSKVLNPNNLAKLPQLLLRHRIRIHFTEQLQENGGMQN